MEHVVSHTNSLATCTFVRDGQPRFVWLGCVDVVRTLSLLYESVNFSANISWMVTVVPTWGLRVLHCPCSPNFQAASS